MIANTTNATVITTSASSDNRLSEITLFGLFDIIVS